MKRAAHRKQNKTSSHVTKRRTKFSRKNIFLGIVIGLTVLLGLYVLAGGNFSSTLTSTKVEALNPTTNISVKINLPTEGAIVTGLVNPISVSMTGPLPLLRFDFMLDGVYQGSFIPSVNHLITPTPFPDGLFHVDTTSPKMLQTHYIQDGTWHAVTIRAIDKNWNYADSAPVNVLVKNGVQLSITPTPGYGPTGSTGSGGVPTGTPTRTPTPVPTAVPTPLPTPTPNLVQNGGFELDGNKDSKPDVWSSAPQFIRSGAVVHSGGYAGMHSSATRVGYTIFQAVTGIIPGRLYNLSGWVNIPSGNSSGTYALQIRWRRANGSGITTKTVKSLNKATNGWVQISSTFTAPAAAASAEVMMHITALKGTIYTDNILLR